MTHFFPGEATILVAAAAAFGGRHAKSWHALPLHLQVTSLCTCFEARMERDDAVLAHAYS